MFALFTSITGAWFWLMWTNRPYTHRIHYLMAALCVFKALTVLSQAGMFHYIERTGHADGWNIAYYIFTFCRGILFFTVVVLIGTGWSYMVRRLCAASLGGARLLTGVGLERSLSAAAVSFSSSSSVLGTQGHGSLSGQDILREGLLHKQLDDLGLGSSLGAWLPSIITKRAHMRHGSPPATPAEALPGRQGEAHPAGGGAPASVCQHCDHHHGGGVTQRQGLVHLA